SGLAACGNSSQPATDSGDGEGDGGALPTVGVLIYKYDDTYISTVRNALQAALDGKAEVIMQDGKGDQATQNDQLDVMIE
ncbi:galactose ABC transporter substrate-binding protein, partial [Klebsiella oxytoca]